MISRRKLFVLLGLAMPAATAAVAATPIDTAAADAAVKAANPVYIIQPDGMMTLASVRDALRPALRDWARRGGYEADILIEYTTDNLLVRARCAGAWDIKGFTITRAEILDNLCFVQFAPRLQWLREQLSAGAFAFRPLPFRT